MRAWRDWLSSFVFALLSTSAGTGANAWAQAGETPLPEPLTLEAALALAEADDPEVELLAAELLRREAERQRSDSRFDTRLSLQLQAQWIEPSDVAIDQSSEDHRVALQASRLLYDFGRGTAQRATAESLVESQRLRLVSARDQRRLRIMRSYFEVLLADLQASAAIENMTVAYLRYDRQREKNLVGQVSDVDLLEAEALYERLRIERDRAEIEQRASRARLAAALNRPTQLSANLLPPQDWPWAVAVPDYDVLVNLALERNPRLLAARAAADAAQNALAAARASDRPTLSAEAEIADYARIESGSDEWRVTLQLDVPLYTGRRNSAEVMQARAGLLQAGANLRAAELDIRQSVLEAWQALNLLSARRQAARAQQDFRDLYLDRSRALYELERQSDLGDAMARFSEARVATADVNYSLMLAWETLRALLGLAPAPDWYKALPTAAAEG